MKQHIYLLGLLLLLGCAVFRPPPVWHKSLTLTAQTQLNQRLSQAGSNRGELEQAFTHTPPRLHPYVSLLIERMPGVDLASCSDALLARTVILADSLRQILPYAQSIPEAVFQDYVLPLRVSQEPLEDFRPFFMAELLSQVQDCTTVEGAAVTINRWCGSKVGFKPTQPRDQGPFETLKSGYGRCEEMMIFFSDACRSLCIPVREAWTPWWTYQDNNHAWTEVWTPEGWQYTGACEPCEALNLAWFSDPVKRAALVLSAKQGEVLPSEVLYRRSERSSLINVTGNYALVAPVQIQLTHSNQPVADTEVFISIFNFGALRPLARSKTDSSGTAMIELGKGDYVLTYAGDTAHLTLLQHRPPAPSTARIDTTVHTTLPSSFWLRFDP